MAKLPLKEASSLAEAMKKRGVPGMIAMGDKTEAPESDEETSPTSEDGSSELDACINDVAEAVASGNKDGIVSALHSLVDCINQSDKEEDDSSYMSK